MAIVRTLIGNVKGVKGDTGAQGEQGNAGEITIGSVTTGSYGTPAAVVNSGTPTNAVLDFTIPQGAPGASVTDASPLVANSITTSIEQYPTYTAGETIATILGKIAKFLSDIRANGLFKSNLINGFTQTTPGVNALDAAAGKSLNDALATNLQTSIVKISKSSSTEHTYTVPSSSRHFVIFACAFNTAYWIGYVHGASAGAVSAYEISKGAQVSAVTTSTNTLKFTTGSNTSGVLIDIVCYGSAMS